MKNKKIYKKLIIIIVVVILSITVFFAIKNIINKKNLKNKFKDYISDYYEIFSKQNVFGVTEGDKLTYSLQDLKELKYDISSFEKNKCNLKESKGTIKITKNGYDISIKLDC